MKSGERLDKKHKGCPNISSHGSRCDRMVVDNDQDVNRKKINIKFKWEKFVTIITIIGIVVLFFWVIIHSIRWSAL